MTENTNIDVAELLAVIGEQTIIARKREQKITELQNRIKELENESAHLVREALKNG